MEMPEFTSGKHFNTEVTANSNQVRLQRREKNVWPP
jgi:hypothetical protein